MLYCMSENVRQFGFAKIGVQLWPEKFNNKTNGITQRRWLLQANPLLAQWLTNIIGEAWITDLEALKALEPAAQDTGLQQEFLRIKRANKERLITVIRELTRIHVDPDSLFDVQGKRIHEYKGFTEIKLFHQTIRYLQ
jgi:glycogen phosphorylase